MARSQSTQEIPEEVRKFLSKNGKMGGATTKDLIEKGKLYEEEHATGGKRRPSAH